MTIETRSASLGAGTHKDEVTEFLVRDLPVGSQELLKKYEQLCASRPAVYLSHPITTGPRFLEWRKEVAAHHLPEDEVYGGRLKREVIAENVRRAAPLRARIAESFGDQEIIDPTEVDVPHWKQWDYHRVWAEVLERFVDTIVFADGWEYSTGCAVEYAVVLDLGLEALDARLEPLTAARANELLEKAAAELKAVGLSNSIALTVARRSADRVTAVYKDEKLAHLAQTHNVASFVSFSPDVPRLRYQVTGSSTPCRRVADPEEAIAFLFGTIRRGSVNVRTFLAEPSKSLPFFYGIETVDRAVELVRKCAAEGYFTIVNETIDVHDGGVSGVTLGGIAEFAPDDTPRAVEKSGTASMPIEMASRLLSTVYGTDVSLPCREDRRVEFSVHPQRVGFRGSHLLVWEVEDVAPVTLKAAIHWPNAFSRLVGDKTFGLLVADSLGAAVPRTTVVSKRVAPFTFGQHTGTGEWWMRTAPAEQEPGHFTTLDRWSDPFQLLADEDPSGRVASVLAQEGVDAEFSGATLATIDGADLVEGVAGRGDDFMLGVQAPAELPERVRARVVEVLAQLRAPLGTVRIEWASDSTTAWVLQVHRMEAALPIGVVSAGTPDYWLEYDPDLGLDVLAELIEKAAGSDGGIVVTRPVGVTSHVGDLLRKAGVPGRIEPVRRES